MVEEDSRRRRSHKGPERKGRCPQTRDEPVCVDVVAEAAGDGLGVGDDERGDEDGAVAAAVQHEGGHAHRHEGGKAKERGRSEEQEGDGGKRDSEEVDGHMTRAEAVADGPKYRS